jgi:hypothetical protein
MGTELNDLLAFLTSPSISPRHLSITTNLLPENQVQFSYPIFQNVTHLTLVWCHTDGSPEGEVKPKWDTLRNLKNLTHMSLYSAFVVRRGFSKSIETIVSSCPRSLRVFIFWISGAWNFCRLSLCLDEVRTVYEGEIDMRVVIGSMGNQWVNEAQAFRRSLSDSLRDRAGIPDEKNFWALAEDMIEERRRRKGLQV